MAAFISCAQPSTMQVLKKIILHAVSLQKCFAAI